MALGPPTTLQGKAQCPGVVSEDKLNSMVFFLCVKFFVSFLFVLDSFIGLWLFCFDFQFCGLVEVFAPLPPPISHPPPSLTENIKLGRDDLRGVERGKKHDQNILHKNF